MKSVSDYHFYLVKSRYIKKDSFLYKLMISVLIFEVVYAGVFAVLQFCFNITVDGVLFVLPLLLLCYAYDYVNIIYYDKLKKKGYSCSKDSEHSLENSKNLMAMLAVCAITFAVVSLCVEKRFLYSIIPWYLFLSTLALIQILCLNCVILYGDDFYISGFNHQAYNEITRIEIKKTVRVHMRNVHFIRIYHNNTVIGIDKVFESDYFELMARIGDN